MFSAPPEHENVLPVLLVRDPYYWMGSMCESPYLMKWMHSKDHCPNLVRSLEEDEGVPAKTMWGRNERKWDSLAHVWSEFNGEYVDADFPRLVIRFEGAFNNCFSVVRTCRPAISSCTTHKSYIHSFPLQTSCFTYPRYWKRFVVVWMPNGRTSFSPFSRRQSNKRNISVSGGQIYLYC